MITQEVFDQYVNTDSQAMDGWFYPMDMLLFYLIDIVQNQQKLSCSLCEVGVWQAKSLVLLPRLAFHYLFNNFIATSPACNGVVLHFRTQGRII